MIYDIYEDGVVQILLIKNQQGTIFVPYKKMPVAPTVITTFRQGNYGPLNVAENVLVWPGRPMTGQMVCLALQMDSYCVRINIQWSIIVIGLFCLAEMKVINGVYSVSKVKNKLRNILAHRNLQNDVLILSEGNIEMKGCIYIFSGCNECDSSQISYSRVVLHRILKP